MMNLLQEIKNYSLNKNKENKGILFIIFLINCLIIPIFSSNYIRKLENEEIENEVIVKVLNITNEIIYPGFNYDNKTIEGNQITFKWHERFSILDNIFYNISNLIEIDFSNFNSTGITSMRNLFYFCSNLKKINFGSHFDTSLVTNMENMFKECSSLEYLNLSTFDTSKNNYFNFMFYNCFSLKSLDLSSFNTEAAVDMREMFNNCTSLTSLDISTFNTKSTIFINKMFSNCFSLTSLDLSGFNTSLVISLEFFFAYCESLTSINLTKFDTSNCQNMNGMFLNCKSLKSLDLSNFNTSSVINIDNMFLGCNDLTSINLSNFNTSKITSFDRLFEECKLLSSLNILNFDSSQVTNFHNMFCNCRSLSSIDLSNFNTTKANRLESMFNNCFELISIDVSNFNTSLVTNMKSMFRNCRKLTSIDLSNFDTLVLEDISNLFEGCNNLEYVNLENFNENYPPLITDMFKGTPEDIIYCIFDEQLAPNINILIQQKECLVKDCEVNWKENYQNMIESKKYDINVINDNCIVKKIKTINKEFFYSNKIQNVSIYSYDLDSSYKFKNMFTNLTFIELSKEQKNILLNEFGLNEKTKLFAFIYDAPSNDSRTATSEYNYALILENGKQLNMSVISENIFLKVTVPIRDLDLANYDLAKEFAEKGYDIYDKTSEFYSDICIPVSIKNNDIVLKDRQLDIYPNNVKLCKENCMYKYINIEEKRIICECNLNTNTIYNDENGFLNDDDGNLVDYVLDNLNYKILKCYHLLLSLDYLKKNPYFYTNLSISVIIILLYLKYIIFKIKYIKINIIKEIPTKQKLKQLIKEQISKNKKNNIKTIKKNIFNPPKKYFEKNKKINIKRDIKSHVKNDSSSTICINLKDSNYKRIKNNKKKINLKTSININFNFNVYKNRRYNNKNKKKDSIIYNNFPYKKAIREDKREILEICKSLIFEKIDFISLFKSNVYFRELKVSEFILSLLIDFFFNALLYSDDVVSHKYHNKGKLKFIVILSLSIISNIITSIIIYFLGCSYFIEEKFERLKEIRNEYEYIYAFNKFFKYLKIKTFCFILSELTVIICSSYYIIIFSIVYSKSQKSLISNYILSLIERYAKSIFVIFLVSGSRKIAISIKSVYLYNTSQYIYAHF